ncbi:carbon-nitrogen hydrolase family protein [Phenylobacterium sp.]|uniref:carbon-nitrogen hydrolase family protein n=1 Tax=Phenylobacterium sp. TaxID=1871053 RepID=UPI0012253DFE|nr:carbon-nitrogen hydrolase family protein [Phenylobacterium sp.]THD64020.1 MAG: carbon-nitrogen hydrolase family protein [Phenylobacterium sp.]
MKIGLIQTRTPATQAAALAHVLPLVREAAADGARFIATPEGTNVLQKDREALLPLLVSLEDDVVVAGLRDAAKALGVWILIGSALVKREDGKAANRSALISPDGAIAATYDKLHMFDVDLPTGETARESATYEPGARAVTARAGDLKLGMTICYDLRFPALYRALALAGAEVMTIPAAFTRPTGAAHWEVLMRARAIETGAFVLAPAQGGKHEDGRGTWGHSLVVAPWGEVIASLGHDEPGVLIADLDLAAPAKARAAIPNLVNARPFAEPAALA